MKIAVIGAGYVGLSNAVLLSQQNEVVLLDIVKDKIDMINSKVSPIKDDYVSKHLANNELNLIATDDYEVAINGSDWE